MRPQPSINQSVSPSSNTAHSSLLTLSLTHSTVILSPHSITLLLSIYLSVYLSPLLHHHQLSLSLLSLTTQSTTIFLPPSITLPPSIYLCIFLSFSSPSPPFFSLTLITISIYHHLFLPPSITNLLASLHHH